MTNEWFNISRIEDFFFTMFSEEVFGKVEVGDVLPDTIDQSVKRYTLIDVGRVRDLNAYGSGSVVVFLFSKSNERREKDVPAMCEMEDAAYQLIHKNKHEHYKTSRGFIEQSYDSRYDMHCNVIEIILTVI